MGRTNSQLSGGGSTADTRAVYHNTRPADWLKLPDYDNVADGTAYFLFLIKKDNPSIFDIFTRYGGTKSLDFGHCENGQFVADYQTYTFDTPSDNNSRNNVYTLKYDDFPLYRNDDYAQVVLRFQGTASFGRIWLNTSSQYQYRHNRGLVDMITNIAGAETAAIPFNDGQQVCLDLIYIYDKKGSARLPIGGLYVDTTAQTVTDYGHSPNWRTNLRKTNAVLKATLYNETFQNSVFLEKIRMDISNVTSFNNPFRNSCNSLVDLKFVNYDNVTEFYDINLGNTALSSAALEEFFKTLPTITTAKTLTCSSCAGYSSLTAEQIAIATAKNWTLA